MSSQGGFFVQPGGAAADGGTVPMAKHTKPIVGLEIDPSAVTAAQVHVNGRLTITRAAMTALEPGIVRDGEVTDVDGLSTALRTLYKEQRGLNKRVRIGLASPKVVVRVMEVPPLADVKELATAVHFQAQDQLPMPLESAVLDFQPLDIVDTGAGPRQRVLLVAARREMVERLISAVRGAGLRPEGIDLSAFAMVRALHTPAHNDDPVLYLAVGGVTNMAVAHGKMCQFTRVAGSGHEGMAVELAERRALTLEHARGWLGHVGLEQPLESIEGDAEIVGEARRVLAEGVRRIAAEVRNSLDYYQAQGAAAPAVQRAVLTGPAVAVPGFAAGLAAQLGIDVDARLVDGTPAGLEPGRVTIAAGLAVTEAPS
jgi:type IV pilus assembly protein PilM